MTLDVQTMKQLSEYVRVKREAKTGGRASIAFGLLAFIGGVAGLDSNILAIPLMALGLFLVGTGVWVIKITSVSAMRWEAIAMWVVAAWNILTGLLSVVFSEGGGAIWVVMGAAQVYWGIQARRRAIHFAAFSANPASAAMLTELERLVNDIQTAPAAPAPDLIEFESASLTTRQHWKARLGKDWAVFVDAAGSEVLVAAPAEVAVAPQGETAIRHRIKAELTLAKRRLKGTIPQESLDRLTGWKAVHAQ
jgi:hypothetical protein